MLRFVDHSGDDFQIAIEDGGVDGTIGFAGMVGKKFGSDTWPEITINKFCKGEQRLVVRIRECANERRLSLLLPEIICTNFKHNDLGPECSFGSKKAFFIGRSPSTGSRVQYLNII